MYASLWAIEHGLASGHEDVPHLRAPGQTTRLWAFWFTPSRVEEERTVTPMRRRFPAFQFYPKDWLSSATIQAMSLEEIGAYILLLAWQWESEDCTLPADDEILARLARLECYLSARPLLASCFPLLEGSETEKPRRANKKLRQIWLTMVEFSRDKRRAGKIGGTQKAINSRNRTENESDDNPSRILADAKQNASRHPSTRLAEPLAAPLAKPSSSSSSSILKRNPSVGSPSPSRGEPTSEGNGTGGGRVACTYHEQSGVCCALPVTSGHRTRPRCAWHAYADQQGLVILTRETFGEWFQREASPFLRQIPADEVWDMSAQSALDFA